MRWERGTRRGRWAHGGAARRAIPAALQPTIGGPLAQWALGSTTGYDATDRSGNGRTLSAYASTGGLCPDLRPGCVALWRSTPHPVGPTRVDAALRLAGAMTLTLRFWTPNTNTQSMVSCAGTGEGEADNTLFSLGLSNLSLRYLAEQGAGNDITFVSTAPVDRGQWRFGALRRNAQGVVTLSSGDFEGFDHVTSGALALPTGGSAATLRIMPDSINTGVSDVGIWDYELTNEELELLRDVAMGRPL